MRRFLDAVIGPRRGGDAREPSPRVSSQSELSGAEARYRIGARWAASCGEASSPAHCPAVLGAVSRVAIAAACRRAVAELRQGSIVELVAQRDAEELQGSMRRVVGAFAVEGRGDRARGEPDEELRDVAAVAAVLLLFAREAQAAHLLRGLLERALMPLGCFGGGGLHACGRAVADGAAAAYPRLADAVGPEALALALETLTPRLACRAFADAVPLTALIVIWDDCFEACGATRRARAAAGDAAGAPPRRRVASHGALPPAPPTTLPNSASCGDLDASAARRAAADDGDYEPCASAILRACVAACGAARHTCRSAVKAARQKRSVAADDVRANGAVAYSVLSDFVVDLDAEALTAELRGLGSPRRPLDDRALDAARREVASAVDRGAPAAATARDFASDDFCQGPAGGRLWPAIRRAVDVAGAGSPEAPLRWPDVKRALEASSDPVVFWALRRAFEAAAAVGGVSGVSRKTLGAAAFLLFGDASPRKRLRLCLDALDDDGDGALSGDEAREAARLLDDAAQVESGPPTDGDDPSDALDSASSSAPSREASASGGSSLASPRPSAHARGSAATPTLLDKADMLASCGDGSVDVLALERAALGDVAVARFLWGGAPDRGDVDPTCGSTAACDSEDSSRQLAEPPRCPGAAPGAPKAAPQQPCFGFLCMGPQNAPPKTASS